jgi:hypothetical protein
MVALVNAEEDGTDLEEDDAETIAADWNDRLNAEEGTDLEVSPDAIQAVSELLALCRRAEQENLDVVFWWSL